MRSLSDVQVYARDSFVEYDFTLASYVKFRLFSGAARMAIAWRLPGPNVRVSRHSAAHQAVTE